MTDTTAKIRAKGLDSTGITEQLATEMYKKKGARYMAIVELKVEERHEKADGSKKVDLVLEQVEPATDANVAEHLRELCRVSYINRAQADGQGTIDEALRQERSTADVLAAGAKHRPHPFLPVDASAENPICDVCGVVEGATQLHESIEDPEPCPSLGCSLDEDHDGAHDLGPHVYKPNSPNADPEDGWGRSCTVCGGVEDEDGTKHVRAGTTPEEDSAPDPEHGSDSPVEPEADDNPAGPVAVPDPFSTTVTPTAAPEHDANADDPFTAPTPA